MDKVLLELFLIFLLARVAGEIMTRLKQPPVIGELVVGAIIGSHALALIHPNDVLSAIAELGVVFLLFEVGLENRFSDLRKVGGTAGAVAVSGVVAPLVVGYLFMTWTGYTHVEAGFVAAALVATSVGVTARVLSDLRLLREIESRVILGAAVIDDVLGLLILAIVAGSAQGSLSAVGFAVLIAEAVFFLVFVTTVGSVLMRRHGSLLDRLHLTDGPFSFGVVFCLGMAALARSIGLAAIVGAFIAGMVLAETKDQFALEKKIAPVTNFLTPFFFVVTGAAVDPSALIKPATLLLGGAVLLIAIVTKLIPCALASVRLGRRSAAIVGVGMVPRGEVGIIVATIGLKGGYLSADVYSVVVAMAVISTVIVPPVLRVLFRDRLESAEPIAADQITPGEHD